MFTGRKDQRLGHNGQIIHTRRSSANSNCTAHVKSAFKSLEYDYPLCCSYSTEICQSTAKAKNAVILTQSALHFHLN